MSEAGKNNPDFNRAALEHLDALYGYALTLTRNRSEAEDLAQETYLRAVRAFGNLAPDSNLKGWLFAIMRNIRLNQLRHTQCGPQFVELDMDEESGHPSYAQTADNPHMALARKVEREQVRAAIERLPQLYREIILLRYFEDFSYQQIADILQCPAGTVMSRLGRARERLRLSLSQWRMEAAAK